MKYLLLKSLCIAILSLIYLCNLNAQTTTKKSLAATRVSEAPKIDGHLDDKAWENVEIATNFTQVRPYNGKPSTQISEVKFVYDNTAIYVGAMLYQTNPDSIYKVLTARDETSTADYFGVYFDPFNDGLNAYGFFVTCMGVQMDLKASAYNEDNSWNAVWKSETRITENGWIVEMKIPYSALRFPKQEVQTWGLNVFRTVQRLKEQTSWNFISQEISGMLTQEGQLKGISQLKSPLRLSATPYISTYFQNNGETKDNTFFLKGGMDLKYGINESFTLDMMLIPDFGQVQSDNKVLNLSPFEVFYSENRQFFTEGTELFEKGDIFYSRRIGAKPIKYYQVSDELKTNELITENPTETQLINSTKISGKTKHGLGIGFLNAMSMNEYATIKDTITGETRSFKTQAFTNYNIFVLDQSLKNNSYVSLTNTNVLRREDKYTANVTATDFSFSDKKNIYTFSGQGAISQLFNDTNDVYRGHYYELNFEKVSGKFRFAAMHSLYSNRYDPNDLGFQNRNNYISNWLYFGYYITKPFWRLLNLYNNLSIEHSSLYSPRMYESFYVSYNLNTTFKNFLSVGINSLIQPFISYDYNEPRTEGKKYKIAEGQGINAWFSTDYRKKLALDLRAGTYSTMNSNHEYSYYYLISPRIRLSNKFFIVYSFSTNFNKNSPGWVETLTDETIIFGKRNVDTYTNSLNANYIFNKKSSLTFRLRHYWSFVTYQEYFSLMENGELSPFATYSGSNDQNFNAFNIDMVYTWQFAPGSELAFVWKNEIHNSGNLIIKNYFDNLDNTVSSPQKNSISLKILYYIDYIYFTKNK